MSIPNTSPRVIRHRWSLATTGLLGLLLCCLLPVSGCGEPVEPYGTVSGRVTFEGEGVPDAVLVFDAEGTPLSVTADADALGQYRARRSATMPGLPPGEYRVSVTPPLFYPGLGPAGAKPPQRNDIPQKYRDPATSGLSITVTDQQEQVFDIPMSR